MFTSSGLTAFVPTADLDAADAFYGGTLALPRIDASPFANVYDSDGTQLRVTLVDHVDAQAHTILGWNVADIDVAVRELVAAGVELR
ncbi:MAG: VOC family protein, partial [Solirubrobacteraceae bacterium]